MSTPRRWWLRVCCVVTTVVVCALSVPSPAAAALPGEYWFDRLAIEQAWTVSRGAGVTVAVVDTGVVGTLGDLRGRVLPGVNLSGSPAKDGRTDPGSGCDEYGGCFSHGTNMALYIAGTGRGAGLTGVAPEAKILPVKIIARDGADFVPEDVARGIRWAVDHGADIVNVSVGGPGACDPSEAAAVEYAYQHDVLVVASTGNIGQAVSTPADCPGALAVGAIDKDFRPWKLSNYGPQTDFVGAGVDAVQETLNGTTLTGGDGTSSATAIVSGTFALLRSHAPAMSARDVVTHALNNVHNGLGRFGVRIDDKLGYGEILPYYAMTYPLGANPPNPIYDAWEEQLGPPAPPSSVPPTPTPVTSAPAPSSTPSLSVHPITAAGDSADDAGSSGGVSGSLIVALVVAVVVLGGAAVLVLTRRRARP